MAGFADVLSGLNAGLSDPNNAGLMGFAQGLLQAGAPHMLTPVPMGQALGMGAAASQQYQSQALQNAMARVSVPFQAMKVQSFARAMRTLNDPKASATDKATARALVANLVSPGMGPSILANSPQVQGPKTAAIQGATPHAVGPGQRLVTGAGAPIVGAQGALPVGTAQAPNGSVAPLPGALPAIAAASGAQAGGAAAATYPFQSALKRTGLIQGPMTNRVLSVVPPAPVVGPFSAATSPAAQAALAQARQRQMGTAQGITQTAPNASPQPQVSRAPPRIGQPQTSGVAPRMAPSGSGTIAPGMSPSQVTGQQVAQKLATTQLANDVQSGQEAQQRVANLEELNAVAGNLKTGPGTEARIAVERALASIPGAVGASAGKLATITNAQIFNKTALNLSLQTVSSAGQTAYNSFETVVHAFPELSKTNMANAVVTASLLATTRYQAAKGNFAAGWQKDNQGMGFVPGKGTAEGAWTKQAPFMAYFMSALPPEAQSMILKKAQTNATLRNEIVQARNALPWLTTNGYL